MSGHSNVSVIARSSPHAVPMPDQRLRRWSGIGTAWEEGGFSEGVPPGITINPVVSTAINLQVLLLSWHFPLAEVGVIEGGHLYRQAAFPRAAINVIVW